ncbi:MAG: DNA mismatch repair protein MutT [Flavobacteriales bacterium]|nr:DNA mismatch repair protein MutT [Flavobacteriales bacterium]
MIVSTDNPWQKIDEEVKYDNSWIKVTHSNVINPAGAKGIYGSVHFKNWAIGIIPLDKNLNTWIVGQYRYPIQQYSWEIPEGGGPIGVSTIETAKRELSEECGLKAKKWTRIQTFHLSNSVSDEYGEIFLAQDLEEFENHPDPEEELVIKKLSFEEVFQMVCKGEITDSISIMGIYKVRFLIENNLI